jgi:hypothetical protein
MKDDFIEPINLVEVPESLEIADMQGLKLESTIVSDEVRMNVKLPYGGVYRIKIRDISKNLVSQEKIEGDEGDNILKVYVSSLENDGYIIELTDDAHDIIGLTTFVVN